jgi:hypothetical protein
MSNCSQSTSLLASPICPTQLDFPPVVKAIFPAKHFHSDIGTFKCRYHIQAQSFLKPLIRVKESSVACGEDEPQ